MNEAFIRTEDIDPKEVKNYFVETDKDREIIELLKGKQPLLVVGSRGTGKTMLLRMAEYELLNDYKDNRNIPIFVNLVTCSFYDASNILSVLISRTLIAFQQALKKQGVTLTGSIFKPIMSVSVNPVVAKLEQYINETSETARQHECIPIDDESIKTDVAKLINFFEEACAEFNIERLTIFFDEACQVFRPTQQRIFFDFFRALRTYNIICKAAVYPGIVTYGTFQKFHDATVVRVERGITDENYITNMRQLVRNHYPHDYSVFEKSGELLDALIYASSGNPRFLLKSLNQIVSIGGKFNAQNFNIVMKEFYGTSIWSEHVKLGDMYPGHKEMINWSRNFIEDKVLVDIEKINANPQPKSTIYFCISVNAPEVVKQSIKTLEYSGIVTLHTEGTKYRTEMYDRYEINLGIVVLFEKQVVIQKRIREIADNISIKVFPDYGKNSTSYEDYGKLVDLANFEADADEIISTISQKDISCLDISPLIQARLRGKGYNTIKDVINSTEIKLQEIPYIGPVRSRKISNIVYNSILEYISG